MTHDFDKFPELTNSQFDFYYSESPIKQITEDFRGRVTKVTDGDTIHVKWEEREKPVRIRMARIAAPELDETGGKESQSWLEDQLLNEEVEVQINPKARVEKWGRLLGEVMLGGLSLNQMSLDTGHSVLFEFREFE